MADIYEPQEDSFLIMDFVKHYAHGLGLDLGCGSGILGAEASKYAEFVYGCDINLDAVEYCKKTYKKIKNIHFLKSDLFENLKYKKFDLIIFNPPYLPYDADEDSDAQVFNCGGKNGWELIEKFISLAGNYLSEEGKILLLFSSLTNKEKVDSLISENGYKFTLLKEKAFFFEKLYVYLVEQ